MDKQDHILSKGPMPLPTMFSVPRRNLHWIYWCGGEGGEEGGEEEEKVQGNLYPKIPSRNKLQGRIQMKISYKNMGEIE